MRLINKLCNVVVALAVMVAPIASGYCRGFFYEEKEPEGVEDFLKKCKCQQRK